MSQVVGTSAASAVELTLLSRMFYHIFNLRHRYDQHDVGLGDCVDTEGKRRGREGGYKAYQKEGILMQCSQSLQTEYNQTIGI